MPDPKETGLDSGPWVVADLNQLTITDTLKRLSELGRVAVSDHSFPAQQHEVCFYLQAKWYTLQWWPGLLALEKKSGDPRDIAIFQNYVLSAIFDIQDPQQSPRLLRPDPCGTARDIELAVNRGLGPIAFTFAA